VRSEAPLAGMAKAKVAAKPGRQASNRKDR